MAGCVLAVRFNSSSGPSKQSRESANPSTASASSNTARAAGDAPHRALPIPANWDPCPGNNSARRPIEEVLRSTFYVLRSTLTRSRGPNVERGTSHVERLISPPQQHGSPHESCAEGGQQDEVAGLHALGLHAFVQRDRDRGRRGVAVALDVLVHARGREFQA